MFICYKIGMPANDQNLTPAQATDLLHSLIAKTRGMLKKALALDYKIDHENLPVVEGDIHLKGRGSLDFNKSSLLGYCGHAQSFLNWSLQERGYAPACFTINKGNGTDAHPAIPSGAAFNHVAMTVDIPTTEGVKTFLLDPTFRQFCAGDKNEPGALLANSPDGEHIVKTLLADGFIELTPEIASIYITAFCKGIRPFTSEKDAQKFLSTSDRARVDNGLWPPKNFFEAKGWISKPHA